MCTIKLKVVKMHTVGISRVMYNFLAVSVCALAAMCAGVPRRVRLQD